MFNSQRAAQTEGKIVQSSSYTSTHDGKTQYHYKISYEYVVNGTIFLSDRVTFTSNYSGSPEYAYRYNVMYPTGKNVFVYYDPLDPQFSVIEPNTTNQEIFLYSNGFVAIFSLISGAYLILSNQTKKRA